MEPPSSRILKKRLAKAEELLKPIADLQTLKYLAILIIHIDKMEEIKASPPPPTRQIAPMTPATTLTAGPCGLAQVPLRGQCGPGDGAGEAGRFNKSDAAYHAASCKSACSYSPQSHPGG